VKEVCVARAPSPAAFAANQKEWTMKNLTKRFPTLALLTAIVLGANSFLAADETWLTVGRGSLCVTEGTIDKSASDRLSVDVPKMRAYVNAHTSQSIEVRFTYRGPTQKESSLGSGEQRRQFGLKLRAHDACNLVYAMWRIVPESKLVVSVKRNPNQHTSAECGNHGYQNVKPRRAADVPHLRSGETHTLRAEMNQEELRVFVDDRQVWAGEVGSEAANLEGPVGIRSDNASLEFNVKAVEFTGLHSESVAACKSGPADSD
jgi:hypothetical protein